MSDSGSGGNQFASEMKSTVAEVAKDVKDSIGEMIEQNVQTAVGSQLTPQQQQQKKQQEQQDLEKARKVISYYKNLGADIKKAQEGRKQKEEERLKKMQEEEQAKKMQKTQMQTSKSPPPGNDLREDIARTQAERSKGRGVGG